MKQRVKKDLIFPALKFSKKLRKAGNKDIK